jgi:hypothetical protein
MGLAIHNFHDTNNGLPYSNLAWQTPSFFCFLYPFAEQTALNDYLSNRGFITNYGDQWWCNIGQWDYGGSLTMTPELRKAFGSVSYMVCPSRRGSPSYYDTSTPYAPKNNEWTAQGPRTDYAFVELTEVGVRWWDFCTVNPGSADEERVHWGAHRAPFRLCQPQGLDQWNNPAGYTPRDTISRLADGTSNQIMIGEKHIPTNRLEKCDEAIPEGQAPNTVDCSYIISGGGWGTGSTARVFRTDWGGYLRLASPRDKTFEEDWALPLWHYSFGSAHPGTTNFVLGDGSVRGISITTPPELLTCLSDVSDGQPVSLP